MHQPDPPGAADAPPAAAHHVPGRTTPTWEMELLISGATVFGLLQLPALTDRVMFNMNNGSAMEISGLVLALWIYAKFSLLTLIGTFIVHLALRGHWVALVGLHSVYPGGIRWDRLNRRMGPNYIEASREQCGDMAELIERADNRASRVFGVGFGMAAVMLVPILLVGITVAVLWTYLRLGGPDGNLTLVGVSVAFLLVFLPYGVLVAWDLTRGRRVPRDSTEAHWLRRGFRLYGAIGFSRSNNPLLMLFASNEGGRRTGWLVGITMALMMGVVSFQAVSARIGWGFGDYRGLPDDRVTGSDLLLPMHYASRRGDAVILVPPPHIPDPVVDGPYLQVFIPYLPSRHNLAMRRRCPEALADTGPDAQRARLDCLATLHDLRIDGQPVAVPLDAAQDPQTGQRGLVAMVPMAGVAAGRHELTVMPATGKGQKPVGPDTLPYRIPFWR
ncbi:MAG TPA: hypothetical protein VFQ84_10025 [Arenimonas sp.]|uniref:hypothetical protein n=1 Tax=Arenimonas sp. TaxID=1872635 RepID=UPI002D803D52|nr:hypothetical protein [Arenimonas sp.]HEU0153670.1 hypothetical protein [Arenimonas sp.]